jgi:hypothetical protein
MMLKFNIVNLSILKNFDLKNSWELINQRLKKIRHELQFAFKTS